MFIHFKLYRSKNNEVFDEGKVEFNIENDDQLVAIDDIMTRIMSDYINNTNEVKKYGIAYVDRLEITLLEITEKDNLQLDEEQFKHYMSTINPNIKIKWVEGK